MAATLTLQNSELGNMYLSITHKQWNPRIRYRYLYIKTFVTWNICPTKGRFVRESRPAGLPTAKASVTSGISGRGCDVIALIGVPESRGSTQIARENARFSLLPKRSPVFTPNSASKSRSVSFPDDRIKSILIALETRRLVVFRYLLKIPDKCCRCCDGNLFAW